MDKINTENSHNPSINLMNKGERVKLVRNMANLSREKLSENSKINIHTLNGWENNRFGGLSRIGAKRLMERVAQEGVQCTAEWLLFGIGSGPIAVTDYKKAQLDAEKDEVKISKTPQENKQIAEELLLFREHCKEAADLIVEDDSMLPHYQLGDYVAGRKRYKKQIARVVGLDCIVQVKEGTILLRTLRQGTIEGKYHLVSTNSATQSKDAVLFDVELISAAPIIWHRKKDVV